MKIALVHDYLREYGGAERVVETLHEIWPEAPLYTAFVDFKGLGRHADRFKNWDIRTSWVQKFPLIKKFISPLRFLAPKIWSSFDLSDYDVVLSSSGWFMCRGVALNNHLGPAASVSRDSLQFGHEISLNNPSSKKSFRSEDSSRDTLTRVTQTLKNPLHICYIHHPPRNLYGYATGSDLQKYWPVRVYATFINFFLRHYDWETAQKVDYFIANSIETKRRVEKFYRRDSTVIYPPININDSGLKIRDSRLKKNYFLSVGRLSWAKRVDVIIKACNELKLPLKIVGVGKEMDYLKSIAGETIEFIGGVSDEELDKLYTGAKALIFCALDEDFGMVPVEAMAHGTPVIGLSQGGVKETVIPVNPSAGSGQGTGVLFEKPEAEDLKNALVNFNKNYQGNNFYKECIKQAEKFGKERFKKEILHFVQEHRFNR
jgi:glycosyltransferase involved in cell wall biosynthesis